MIPPPRPEHRPIAANPNKSRSLCAPRPRKQAVGEDAEQVRVRIS